MLTERRGFLAAAMSFLGFGATRLPVEPEAMRRVIVLRNADEPLSPLDVVQQDRDGTTYVQINIYEVPESCIRQEGCTCNMTWTACQCGASDRPVL